MRVTETTSDLFYLLDLSIPGPVVFPPPPTDGPMESSGVVVGASGYGFVPPNTPPSKPGKVSLNNVA